MSQSTSPDPVDSEDPVCPWCGEPGEHEECELVANEDQTAGLPDYDYCRY